MSAAPRFFCPVPLLSPSTIALGAGAARHAQVLRLQPGDRVTLFDGWGGEFKASISEMGRRDVQVTVGQHHMVEREPARELHLAIGVPANERMDWLVEKATELGVASIQPLMTERSVVRLDEQRAHKKTAHWNSIAIAACEQCGRNRVPAIHPATALASWSRQTGGQGTGTGVSLVLSLRAGVRNLREVARDPQGAAGPVTVLSGPEGGLSTAEEELALRKGFEPVSLGSRVLRAETAALAALTLLA